MSVISNKLIIDISWNFFSIVILGISGLILNFVIGRFYGPAILGVFNQVFAIYIFSSQLAVFGLYFSVLKHISEFNENFNQCANVLICGLLVTTFFSSVVTGGIFLLSGWIGNILKSKEVQKAILYILPALWFTGFNKVLMAALNGHRHMKTFAVAQAIRYILMLIFLGVCLLKKFPGVTLPGIISIAEGGLLLFLGCYVIKLGMIKFKKFYPKWIKTHLKFGAKSFLSGTIASLNTRIDILMLGYFGTDKQVGIYSLSALIVEGLMMFSYAVRDNVNPILAKLIAKNQIKKLQETIKVLSKNWYIIVFFIGSISIILYPWFIKIFMKNPAFLISWSTFSILMYGYILSAGYIPFNMLLVQAGYPGLHTLLKLLIIINNVLLNLIFIPLLGINGAALATALTFILSIFYLKLLSRKVLKIKI